MLKNTDSKDKVITKYTVRCYRPKDLKNKKICVYCASGYRGNIAADELVKAGFSAVNLEGGYMAWTQ